MKIACQSCGAKYTIADEKVSGKTVKIKCKKCGATVVVDGHSQHPEAMGAEVGGGAGGEDWTVSVSDDDQRTLSAPQIVAEYQRGTINGDTFVWREGMAEWLPLSQVSELSGALGAAVGGAAEPPTHNAPRTPTGGAGGYGYSGGAAAAAAPAAARTKKREQVDLFGGGGGGGAADAAPASSSAAHIGERNENSVLFSLSALTAAETAAKKSAPAAKAPGGRGGYDAGGGGGSSKSAAMDDIMNLGSGSIATSASLAPPPMNAPYIEPPPPPPPPQSYHPASMGPGGPASMHPGMHAMQPMGYEQPPKKAPIGLIVGGILGVIVLAGGAFFLGRGGGDAEKDKTVAANDTASKSKPVEEAPKKDDAPKTDETPKADDTAGADAKPEEGKTPIDDGKTADGKPADTSTTADTSKTAPTTPPVGGPLPPSTAKKEDPKKEDPKKEEPKEDPAASATGQFDRGAAQAALGSAAGGAKGCKKDGGPTGSTKVQVTFAPSGRVTTVNVGSPFAGTPVGSCIAGAFKGLSVPAFSGSPVTVSKSVSIK